MPWTYPLIMSLALATGWLVSRGTQRTLPLRPGQRLGIGLGAFLGGMIGAKLPFVLLDWDGFLSGQAWFDSGKTIMVGLVGGYFGVEVTKWALGIQLKTGDTFAAPVAAAIAVGRLACFCAPCCFGTPTDLPWGVDFHLPFDPEGTRRHPTQLYEFLFHGAAAVCLAWLHRRGMFRGQLIKLYILSYLAYRLVTEFIRPEAKTWLDLTIYQWAALGLAPVFIFLWWHDERKKRRDQAFFQG